MDEPLPTAERNLAVAVSVALVAAVLGPLRQQGRVRPRDGFPLSYYPMFSARRTGQLTVTHLVGVDTCRVSRPLCSSLHGAGGMNQQRKQLRRLARRSHGERVVTRVAARIAARADHDDLVEVRLVTGTYDTEAWFRGDHEP
nr:hypothetical protein [Acidimicrobiia bacterium]